jgi:hypothetical protein
VPDSMLFLRCRIGPGPPSHARTSVRIDENQPVFNVPSGSRLCLSAPRDANHLWWCSADAWPGRSGSAAGSLTPSQVYDERPARARGTYGFEAAGPPPSEPSRSLERSPRRHARTTARQKPAPAAAAVAASAAIDGAWSAAAAAPEGFPRDLPPPEPLSPADTKDSESLVGGRLLCHRGCGLARLVLAGVAGCSDVAGSGTQHQAS